MKDDGLQARINRELLQEAMIKARNEGFAEAVYGRDSLDFVREGIRRCKTISEEEQDRIYEGFLAYLYENRD